MGNLLRPDQVGAAWLENAKNWPVTASEVWRVWEPSYVAEAGYTYQYFSPYRPLDFIGAQFDHVLVASTEPYHHFLFTKAPLPIDRICAWQLIPITPNAWQAAEAELNAAGATLDHEPY